MCTEAELKRAETLREATNTVRTVKEQAMAFEPTSEVPGLQLLEQKTVLTCALLLYLGGAGELQHICQLPPECGTCLGCVLLSLVMGTAMSREQGLLGFAVKILQPRSVS